MDEIARGSKLDELTYAVVDVETTGLVNVPRDRVTEIAIVRVERGVVGEVYSQLVNPERPIPWYITHLTDISDEMVRDQPRFSEIIPEVVGRLQGAVFVGHNAKFDWRFVDRELQMATGCGLSGPRLCTVDLARALLPELERRSLDDLTSHLKIRISNRHRAAGDAIATARALCQMFTVAREQGVLTWEQLQASIPPPKRKKKSGGKTGTSGAPDGAEDAQSPDSRSISTTVSLTVSPTSGDRRT